MIKLLPPGAVVLRKWNIIKIEETGSKHFVGFSIYDHLGRVSTPIVEFDRVAGKGVTESGSIYSFEEPPGKVHTDALYVLKDVLDDRAIKYKWVYPLR